MFVSVPNMLSGKTEVRKLNGEDADNWSIFTEITLNSIVRKAKSEGFGERSPRTDITEYIGSDAVGDYDPIKEYLENLPAWDGQTWGLRSRESSSRRSPG